ncbi:MAG TPA: D-lactate dehydrogenase, partial [Pantoea sp.]|nr:D-lactate dehydrogenase [Pantoea sp.]
MKIADSSSIHYDQKYFEQVNQQFGFELVFFDFLLTDLTAINAVGCHAVCF